MTSFAKRIALPQPAWWQRLQRDSQQAWQRLAPRERTLVSLGGLVVGLAIVWLLLFEPAWNTVQRWRTTLPQLNAQAAQLDAILAEARELQRSAGAGQLPLAEVGAAITESLQRAGLASTASVTQTEPERWQVTLEQAPVGATLGWLQTLPFELRLPATEVLLERAAGPDGRRLAGRLSGHIIVQPPGDTP